MENLKIDCTNIEIGTKFGIRSRWMNGKWMWYNN